ncbi:MAG TPA: extracellular solute-binding protein [Chloroflexota bacterium]|nr:extracellular solute-binding protein [Chloroflexota bacterium]
MSRWKLSRLCSGLLCALLIVAACAPPSTPAPTQAPAKPADSTAAKPAESKPAEAAKPAAPAAQPAATAAQKPAEAAKPADSTAAKPAAGGAPVKLSFIGVESDDQKFALSAVLAEYQKTRPEVTVEFELLPFPQLFPKIQANAAAKAPTDIILTDGPNLWSFAYNGIIAPMDEWFDKALIEKSWTPTSLATSSYRGKFYAPPQMESCSIMWFNKDMTDKAGIKPPDALAQTWTMDQALDAWQKTNNPPQTYGIRWGQGNTPGQDYEAGLMRRAAGKKDSKAYKGIADDGLTISGYFDDPQAVMGLTFFHELYQKHKVSAVEGIPDAWVNQKAAFFISPDNALGTYKRLNATFQYGVTGIPYFKDGAQICHTDSWHYGLGANSANKKEAAEFIKFASGPVGSKIFYDRFGQLPAHLDVLNTLPDYQQNPRKLLAEQFKAAGAPRIQTVGFTEYNGLMIELVGNLVAGQNLDVQQLATALAKRADGLTAKYKDWQTKPMP